MFLLLAVSLAFADSPNTKQLAAQCYDENSAPACQKLGETLAKSKAASDRARGELAARRACTLSGNTACPALVMKPELQGPLHLKRAAVNDKISNLAAVLQDARLEEKLPDGFEFTQIEPKSIYETLGFKEKDILMEVNKHRIDSAAKATELFLALKNETDFAVRIKRKGQPITLTYHIED
jgi:hypothetical protein